MQFCVLLLFSCGFRFSSVAFSVFAAETLDAAGGVHKFLLAGEKWMARGTDFHADVALMGRAGNKGVPAGAMDANFVIVRMNSCFHSGQPLDSAI